MCASSAANGVLFVEVFEGGVVEVACSLGVSFSSVLLVCIRFVSTVAVGVEFVVVVVVLCVLVMSV